MSAGLNDNELIEKVIRGDHQAYAWLVQRYQSYVFTLTLRMIKNREEAEEVAQDVFIKAYKYLADFRGEAKFSTWLYTIVNNTCISFLRKKKPTIHSLDDERVFLAADRSVNGNRQDSLEQKSVHAVLTEAIHRLGHDDAEIITLFYKHEQTLDEISRILGVEVNTAKVRLHRARIRLKEKMETHYATEIKDLI